MKRLLLIVILAGAVVAGVVVFALRGGGGLTGFSGGLPEPVVSQELDGADHMVREAINDLLIQIEQSPSDPKLRRRLAQMYHANSIVDVTEEAYEQATVADPDDAQTWYLLGMYRSEHADFAGAIAAVQRATELLPMEPGVPGKEQRQAMAIQRRLGMFLLETGDLEGAKKIFQTLRAREPDNPLNETELARVLIQQGEHREAIAILEPRLPENMQRGYWYPFVLISAAYRAVGEPQRAAAAALQGRGSVQQTLDPWVTDLNTIRTGRLGLNDEALRQLNHNNPQQALKLLLEARRNYPEDYFTLNSLATTYDVLGQHDDMLKVLRDALELDDSQFATHLNLSVAYERNGDFKKSVDHAKRATEINPDAGDAWMQLGRSQSRLGREDDAIESFRAAMGTGQTSPDVRMELAKAMIRARQWDAAAEELRTIVDEAPTYGQAWLVLAQVEMNRANYQGALAAAIEARKLGLQEAEQLIRAIQARAG